MKRTGIPFKKTYQPNEKILVDMSKLNFDSKDQELTAMIYLRNINSDNLYLDFSSCDYDRKAKMLTAYATSKFYFKEFVFINAIVEVEAEYLGIESIDFPKPFFTPEERKKYIEENRPLVEEIAKIYSSAPVFAMPENLRNEAAKSEKTKYVGKNVRYLYSIDDIDELIVHSAGEGPVYFENLAADPAFMNGLLNSSSSVTLVSHLLSHQEKDTINQIISVINGENQEAEVEGE